MHKVSLHLNHTNELGDKLVERSYGNVWYVVRIVDYRVQIELFMTIMFLIYIYKYKEIITG